MTEENVKIEEYKDCWDVTVTQQVNLRVVFDKPLSADEAMESVRSDEYEDIIDEMDQEIISVQGAR